MKACHDVDALESPAFADFHEFLRECFSADPPCGSEELERFESRLRGKLFGVGREVMRKQLERLDVGDDQVRVGEKLYRRVAHLEATYLTSMGPVCLRRHLFEAKGEHHAICPVEMRAGIVEGEYTPQAARLMARMVSAMPSDEAEAVCKEWGGMTPSGSALDRLPKKLSTRWEAHRQEWEAALRKPEPIPEEAVTCAISLDGVLVPMNSSEAKEKQEASGKQPMGPADYREAACGTVSFYNYGAQIN